MIAGSVEWKADCLKHYGYVLTGEKAHWCYDWDWMPIDETTGEFKCCTCYQEREPLKDNTGCDI